MRQPRQTAFPTICPGSPNPPILTTDQKVGGSSPSGRANEAPARARVSVIPLRVRCLVTLPWAAAGPRDFEPERPRVVLVRALPPDGDRAGDLPLAEAACAGRDGTPAGAGVPCRDVVAGGLLAGDQRRTVHLSRCHRAFGLPQTHSAKEGVEIVCRVEIDWSEAGQVTLGAVRAFHQRAWPERWLRGSMCLFALGTVPKALELLAGQQVPEVPQSPFSRIRQVR